VNHNGQVQKRQSLNAAPRLGICYEQIVTADAQKSSYPTGVVIPHNLTTLRRQGILGNRSCTQRKGSQEGLQL
jgi:hypothetical protein